MEMDMILVFVIASALCTVVLVIYNLFRVYVSVTVNCWFCNENSSVPYASRSSWDCRFCGQYNGFKPDGDYNKVIPGMFCEDVNDSVTSRHVFSGSRLELLDPARSHDSDRSRRDLCSVCSQNQLLKIKQLANFVPQNEANFDIEVEAYRHHLDLVYQLCRACDVAVHRELARQDAVIRAKMHNAGLLRSQSTVNASDSRLSETDFPAAASTSTNISHFISLMLQFFSMLVALMLAVAMMDSVSKSYNIFLCDNEVLLSIRQYSGPVASVGIFVEIAAVMVAGQSRVKLVDVVSCFSWLLTMLACGWLGESICRHSSIIRLTLTSATVAISSCALACHCCSRLCSKPRLLHEVSGSGMPVSANRRSADYKMDQTKPDDPKFVCRLKTLNIGVVRKRHGNQGLPGPFGVLAKPDSTSVDDAFHRPSIHNYSSQHDGRLLKPAHFIAPSSNSSSSVRPPSKWTPVSLDWNTNEPGSKNIKTDDKHKTQCVGPDVINGCDKQTEAAVADM